MCANITDDDVGKEVVNASGEKVGMVADVEHGTAHVEPDPGITDSIKATLGWSDTSEDSYPLQDAAVDRITDDEIRLQRDLEGATSGGTGMERGESGTDRGDDELIDTDLGDDDRGGTDIGDDQRGRSGRDTDTDTDM